MKAVSVLWYLDLETPGISLSAKELSNILKHNSIGKPTNNAVFVKQIQKTKCVYKHGNSFSLKESGKPIVHEWIIDILDGEIRQKTIDIGTQIFPETVWKNTRGYLEKVSIQINGCYHNGFYDACAVLIRRVIETLIIECYIHEKRDMDIKGDDGNYFMLSGLVEIATCKDKGLDIGRESKKALKDLKRLGDLSAHTRKYNAKKTDIDNIKDALRLCAEELINTTNLKSSE